VKIATFNVNGVNGRIDLLVDWLTHSQPDVACLQELKSPDEKFPARAIEKAGMARAAGTASPSWRAAASRSRPIAGCPAIRTTVIRAISRRPCAAS
jgi:exodeoxyribonuclease-3